MEGPNIQARFDWGGKPSLGKVSDIISTADKFVTAGSGASAAPGRSVHC